MVATSRNWRGLIRVSRYPEAAEDNRVEKGMCRVSLRMDSGRRQTTSLSMGWIITTTLREKPHTAIDRLDSGVRSPDQHVRSGIRTEQRFSRQPGD